MCKITTKASLNNLTDQERSEVSLLGQAFACRLNVPLLRPNTLTDCHYSLHDCILFLDQAMYELGFSTLPLKINFAFPLKIVYEQHRLFQCKLSFKARFVLNRKSNWNSGKKYYCVLVISIQFFPYL